VISKWKHQKTFSKSSFFGLFGFGFKLMLSALLNTAFEYFNYIIIGKYYSASHLGHYTRADQFKALPSQNLTDIINRVSFPVLSELQGDDKLFKSTFIRITKISMFLSFVLMLGMAAISQNLIFLLIGEKWRLSVEYLQLLCFVGMLYPLHALNLNVVQVFGRSDIFLRLEVVKKIILIPSLLLGIFLSVKAMIYSLILISFISFYLNARWTGKKINYSWIRQLIGVAPSFIFAFFISASVYLLDSFLHFELFYRLSIQVVFGVFLFFLLGELKFSQEYTYIRQIVMERLLQSRVFQKSVNE
jgi:O-antigen/teichoic acid export membrane protein